MTNSDQNKPKNGESQDERRHQGDAEHDKKWQDPKKSGNNPDKDQNKH
jgi:hypothetical protein